MVHEGENPVGALPAGMLEPESGTAGLSDFGDGSGPVSVKGGEDVFLGALATDGVSQKTHHFADTNI